MTEPSPIDPLKKLEQEIGAARATDRQEEPPVSGGDAMRLGVELVAGVAVGSTAGFFLDRWLGTMPLFFVICFFLGAAAGFRNMMRG